MKSYTIDKNYVIPVQRMNNSNYLNRRVSRVPEGNRGAVSTVLRYLYLYDGPTNIPPDRYKSSIPYLEDREIIILNWLRTRTNGKLRKSYGKESLVAARKANYHCERCGISDVRVLNLDHVHGKTKKVFACLCANCHHIKSREEDWNSKK